MESRVLLLASHFLFAGELLWRSIRSKIKALAESVKPSKEKRSTTVDTTGPSKMDKTEQQTEIAKVQIDAVQQTKTECSDDFEFSSISMEPEILTLLHQLHAQRLRNFALLYEIEQHATVLKKVLCMSIEDGERVLKTIEADPHKPKVFLCNWAYCPH